MKSAFCLSLLAISTVISLPAFAEKEAAKNSQPNFIVIFCDNLGYGDIEPFGSTLHRTPNLNRMAEEGRKFTHFYVSAGVCTPSRASLITGCYSQRVGLHMNPRDYHVLRPVSPFGLDPDEVTIAESLKELGYTTGMIGKWHLGDQRPFLPSQQGFDFFFGVPYSDDMTERIWNRDGSHWPPLPLMENNTVLEAPVDRNGLTKRYTEVAIDWIGKNKDKPFFLYIPQAMPGSTATPFSSEGFRGRSKNGPWGDSIEELDWSMGEILNFLEEEGLAENTLVVWTSDNGAPIQKDTADLSRGSNLPLNGRGYNTSEGAFRVPTIMWWPGHVPPNTVCEELSSTMDLFPTFAALGGGKSESKVKRDGYDISDLILGTPSAKTPYPYYAYYYLDQLQAVRSGPWKLFLPLDDFRQHPRYTKRGEKNGPLLFNVVEDIGCQQNVAATHPEIVERLSGYAEEIRADLGDSGRKGKGQRPLGKVDNPVPVVLKE